MIHYITLGKDAQRRERPVCFDHTLAYEFQKTTGKHYLQETDLLLKDLIAVGIGAQTDDPHEAAKHMDVVRMVDFFHAALRLGARKAGIQVDFDEYDVCDWVMSEEQASRQLTAWLVEDTFTMPTANDDGKKKTVTIPKKKANGGS